MSSTSRRALPFGRLVLLIAFVAMAIDTARRLEFDSGIVHFVSESSNQELALVSAHLLDAPSTRTMVLGIVAADLSAAVEVSRRWEGLLLGHPEVARLRAGPDPSLPSAVYDLYFPRRHLFLSDRPESELPKHLSDAGLRDAARKLRRTLTLPQAQLTKETAPEDPLLAFPTLLERFEAARRGGLEVQDGHFVLPESRTAVIFLTTRHTPFDASSQAPFDDFLESSFASVEREFEGEQRLLRSGVHRFAVASEQHARADMRRISSISMIGIVLLFLLVYRSLRLLVVTLLPLLGGILTAAWLALAVFGELHLMTLVFGATLLGVCIDYPVHYVTHHTLVHDATGASRSLARIWNALFMGAMTTVAGFLGLASSDFPGVRQIGIFAAAGVLAALVTTRVLMPPLLPDSPNPSAIQSRLAAHLARLLEGMSHRRALLGTGLVGALVVTAVGLPSITWDDDVFSLGVRPDESWAAEDARLRAAVSQMDPGRFVVAIADDEEEALRRNDEVFARLHAARRQGIVADFRSVHSFLFSADLQRRNAAALAASSDLGPRVLAALESEGFRGEAFAPFASSLAGPVPTPLRWEDLEDSPLSELISSFRVDLPDRVALLTFLRGVSDDAALDNLLADLDGVHYFEQQRFLSEVYGRFRARTVALIGAGLLAVVALLRVRYGSTRLALVTAMPAILAAGCCLSLLALSGRAINLMHMLGLLLVLSMGVDYAIFLAAERESVPARAAAMLSLCVAAASTCLSFGLLATSSFPALRALGTVTGLGVLLSLLLTPSVLLLLESGEEGS